MLPFTALYVEQYFYESGNVNIAQSTLATCKMHMHKPRIDESKEMIEMSSHMEIKTLGTCIENGNK